MFLKTIIISIISLLIFSSCSSSRYGHLPRGKRQKHIAKKETRKWEKQKLTAIELQSIEASYPTVVNINLPKVIAPKKQLVSKQNVKKKTIANTPKQVNSYTPPFKQEALATSKKTASNQLKKTTDFDFWDSFWGDLIAEIIVALILIAIASFFIWLEAIGLGWLAALLGLVILVLIFVWIGSLIIDFFDMVFS